MPPRSARCSKTSRGSCRSPRRRARSGPRHGGPGDHCAQVVAFRKVECATAIPQPFRTALRLFGGSPTFRGSFHRAMLEHHRCLSTQAFGSRGNTMSGAWSREMGLLLQFLAGGRSGAFTERRRQAMSLGDKGSLWRAVPCFGPPARCGGRGTSLKCCCDRVSARTRTTTDLTGAGGSAT